jgi:hypothetical protein
LKSDQDSFSSILWLILRGHQLTMRISSPFAWKLRRTSLTLLRYLGCQDIRIFNPRSILIALSNATEKRRSLGMPS